ncbi:MAG: OmpA family protein [Acidimicrobiales bacterium]
MPLIRALAATAGVLGMGVGGVACSPPQPSDPMLGPASFDTRSEGETGYWTVTVVGPDGETSPTGIVPGVIVRIPGDVLFETGSSRIRPGEARRLEGVAAQLVAGGGPITVVGHTDNVGSDEANLVLGADRAAAVRDLLIDLGLPAGRIVAVETAGEACPVAANATAAGRTENRRVELVLTDGWAGCGSSSQGSDPL